jgi:hypothetical protein
VNSSNHRGISLSLPTYKILSSIILSWLNLHADKINGDQHDFDTTDQLLIRFPAEDMGV